MGRDDQVIDRVRLGETYRTIAGDLGISRQRVQQIARAAGLPRRMKTPKRLDLVDRERARRMYVELAMPVTAVARELGCGAAAVRGALKAAGVEHRNRGRRREVGMVVLDCAARAAVVARVAKGETFGDVAIDVGVTRSTVAGIVRRARAAAGLSRSTS